MMHKLYNVPSGKMNGAHIIGMTLGGRADTGYLDISLDLVAEDPQIAMYFRNLVRGDVPEGNTMGLHLIKNEFICAWCGTANPITGRFCSQCGAPRGFVLQDNR